MKKRQNTLVIAVDIGSTRIHVGLVDIEKRRCVFRADFLTSATDTSLPPIVNTVRRHLEIAARTPVVIAGGRGGLAKKVERYFKRANTDGVFAPATHLRWHKRLPLHFRYVKAYRLGADRIADTLYAVTAFPKSNAIIIDSGTAITVDAVSDRGEFLGGVILAGITTQLQSLHAATVTLPKISLTDEKVTFPGNSTGSCMKAGAALGTAGALNHLVKKYRSLFKGKCLVFATGGAWHVTEKLIDFGYKAVPDMTLIGTALYHAYRSGRRSSLQARRDA